MLATALPVQRHLSPLELRQLKWMLGNLLVLVSLWTLVYVDVGAGALLALTAIVDIAVMARPDIVPKLPAYTWTILIPIVLTAAIIGDFWVSQPDIIPPLTRMLLLLVLVRCVQQRRRREDMQLILMSLFMVMLTGVLTASVTFAIQILAFTPLAMGLLFLVTLTEPVNLPYNPDQMDYGWSEFRWPRFIRRVRAAQDYRVLGIIIALFVGVLLVSAGIFTLIPRFQLSQAIPYFNLNTTGSLSGFTERVEFGDVVNIIQDESVALRVDAPNRSLEVDSPYWRMITLDEYDRGVFKMSVTALAYHTAIRTALFSAPGLSTVPFSDRQTWTFYLEPGVSRYLPMVGRLASIRFENQMRFEFNSPLHTLNLFRTNSKVLFYQTQSDIASPEQPSGALEKQLGQSRSIASNSPTIPYPFTTLVVPPGEENLLILDETLRSITGDIPMGPRAFAAAAVDYHNKHHKYALSVTLPSGKEEPPLRWLRSELPGHCELFAGAFTLLARRAGFPTRMVTGFKGGVWNGYENYYMVRNKNAHAWCEVYDGSGVWFRVDPTPGSGDPLSAEASTRLGSLLDVDRTLGAYFDSLKILWYRRIIKFDQTQQRQLVSYLSQTSAQLTGGLRESARRAVRSAIDWVKGLTTGGVWSAVAVTLLIAVIIVGAVKRLPSLREWLRLYRGASRTRLDPVRQKAGKFLMALRTSKTARHDLLDATEAQWQSLEKRLLLIRYGDSATWPEYGTVFRQAKLFVKHQRKR